MNWIGSCSGDASEMEFSSTVAQGILMCAPWTPERSFHGVFKVRTVFMIKLICFCLFPCVDICTDGG